MTWETLDVLAGHGYSEREAAVLYLVAAHSGYFLRRQFNQFVHRERGAIASHFLEKACRLGHVVELNCADGRKLYHLRSRRIYRGMGRDGSQSRRVKSPTEILRRLMALDYVISHLDRERFAENTGSRHSLLNERSTTRGRVEFALRVWDDVLISIPILEPRRIRFIYLDPGKRTTANLARFLRAHLNLLQSLSGAEVVYAAAHPTLFADARRAFERLMPLRYVFHAACPRGVEHLIRWLEMRKRFLRGREAISPDHHRFLTEGDRIYQAPVHTALIASFENGAMDGAKVRSIFGDVEHRVRFEALQLVESYPRILISPAGYPAGYSENQKSLFSENLAQNDPEKTGG